MVEKGLSHWLDYVILVMYFVFVLAVGIWTLFRKDRSNVKGYFLAGRTIPWWPIGASLFSSNIGSEHFIGLAGTGAVSGIAVVAFEWSAAILLLLLGWIFLPVYISSRIFTVPEYLGKRFGGYRMRLYLSGLSVFLTIVVKIAVDVYAGTVFIQQALGWDTYISIIALLGITALYTIAGGLAAVIYTDTLQTAIMVIGAIILSALSFVEVGGYEALSVKYMKAIPTFLANSTANNTCGYPREDAFHIFRDPLTADLPWPGVVVRSTLASLWYWCTDQIIVQRTLAGKNLAHARGGTIMAGYLKLLPLFVIIFPGMISRILYTDDIACTTEEACLAACDNAAGCSNIAYPRLVLGLAPVGLKGLLMAVMLAALMSSLTSIFNSASTIITMDLWNRIRPKASERELLIVGKVAVVILVAIGVVWIPVIKSSQGGQLFIYTQAITGYIAPPICAMFILGILFTRINFWGAFFGMCIGQVLGLSRMIAEFVDSAPGCGKEDTRNWFVRLHHTYVATFLFFLSGTLCVVISLLTPAQPKDEVKGLTYFTCGSTRDKHQSVDLRKQPMLKLEERANFEKTESSDSSMQMHTVTTSEMEFEKRFISSIYIPKNIDLFLNLNAGLLIGILVFLYAFFG